MTPAVLVSYSFVNATNLLSATMKREGDFLFFREGQFPVCLIDYHSCCPGLISNWFYAMMQLHNRRAWGRCWFTDFPVCAPPAIGWGPTQGEPRLPLFDSWDRLQQTPATLNWISRYRKWMDERMDEGVTSSQFAERFLLNARNSTFLPG